MDEEKARKAALAQAIDLGLIRREDISTTQLSTRRGQRNSSRIEFNPNRNVSTNLQVKPSKPSKDNITRPREAARVGSGAWSGYVAPADEDAAQLGDLSGGQSHRRGANFAPQQYKVDTKTPNLFKISNGAGPVYSRSNEVKSKSSYYQVDTTKQAPRKTNATFLANLQPNVSKSQLVNTMKRGLLENHNISRPAVASTASETQRTDVTKQAPLKMQDKRGASTQAGASESHYNGAKENVRRMRSHQAEMEARHKLASTKPLVEAQNEVADMASHVSLLTDSVIGELCQGTSDVSFHDREELIRSELMGLDLHSPSASSVSVATVEDRETMILSELVGCHQASSGSMASMAPMPKMGSLTSSKWA